MENSENELIVLCSVNGVYYAIRKKDNEFVACKRIGDTISETLTDGEKGLVYQIFDQIKYKGNLKLDNIVYENKEYSHSYDPINDIHRFSNLDSTPITKDEGAILNKVYNHRDGKEYVSSSSKENNSEYIKRIIRYKTKSIAVLLLASTAALGVPKDAVLKAYAKETKSFEAISEPVSFANATNISDSQKIANIRNAINSNDNLSTSEKNIILSGIKYIEDNIDVIDYDTILDRVKTLKIIYKTTADPKGKAAGTYSVTNNAITLYKTKGLDSTDKKTICHEISHVFQGKHQHSGLFEPINTLFNTEYYGTKNSFVDKSYNQIYIRILIEIIGVEPIRKYNCTGEESYIVNALKKVINSESKIYNLITDMDDYTYLYSSASNKDALQNDIEDKLNEFYTKKYGKSMYTNPVIAYALVPEIFTGKLLGDSSSKDQILPSHQMVFFNKSSEYYRKEEKFESVVRTSKEIKITGTKEEVLSYFNNLLPGVYHFDTIDELVNADCVKEESKSKNIYSYIIYEERESKKAITEETLTKNLKTVEKAIDELRSERSKKGKASPADKELEKVNMKVKKLDNSQKMVYKKNKKAVINIDSAYVKKINSSLAANAKKLSITYSLVPEMNIISVYVKSDDSTYMNTYNINLITGEKFSVKKYLTNYNASDTFLDKNIDMYFVKNTESGITIEAIYKTTNGKTKKTTYKVVNKGLLTKKSAREADGYIALEEETNTKSR